MAHYVICDNKCLDEAYTAKAIDKKFYSKEEIEDKNEVISAQTTVEIEKKIQMQQTMNDINYKLKKDFAILTGGFALGTQKRIAYPNGFNVSNCVVVSIGAHKNTDTASTYGYGSDLTASSYMTGGVSFEVALSKNEIILNQRQVLVGNDGSVMVMNAGEPFTYKIVLMKV